MTKAEPRPQFSRDILERALVDFAAKMDRAGYARLTNEEDFRVRLGCALLRVEGLHFEILLSPHNNWFPRMADKIALVKPSTERLRMDIAVFHAPASFLECSIELKHYSTLEDVEEKELKSDIRRLGKLRASGIAKN